MVGVEVYWGRFGRVLYLIDLWFGIPQYDNNVLLIAFQFSNFLHLSDSVSSRYESITCRYTPRKVPLLVEYISRY